MMETSKIHNFESAEENIRFEGVKDIEPKDLSRHTKEVVIVDVREPDEFTGELGHIPGAHSKPLGDIEEWCSSLPKDKTVVFVCLGGGRSAKASAYAMEHGYTNVYNMKGGMLLWNQLHLPTEA
jgi:hydroxyacylglutathione hydrolase